MKYGVIDVGGGLRGIYGAGVLDRCLEEDLRFDLCIGVSAGSANMASYLAGQHGRNKPFYDEYSFRREYMSVHNLIHKHSYLDLGYVYGTLSNAGGENYAALARSPAELCVVAANAQNGEAQYFTKADLHPDDYRVLMASCCIPVIDQPCVIDGVPYFDGGLADPVPLEWAFAHGCDRVALILTKPIGLVSSDARDKHLAHLLQSHYPAAAEGLRRRAWRYNTAVQRARELERQGLVCIIAPDSTEGMSTLTKNRAEGAVDIAQIEIGVLGRMRLCSSCTPAEGVFIVKGLFAHAGLPDRCYGCCPPKRRCRSAEVLLQGQRSSYRQRRKCSRRPPPTSMTPYFMVYSSIVLFHFPV